MTTGRLTAVDIVLGRWQAFPPTWRLLDDVELLDLPDPEFLIGLGAHPTLVTAARTRVHSGVLECSCPKF